MQQLSGEINGLRSLQQHLGVRLDRIIYSLQKELVEQYVPRVSNGASTLTVLPDRGLGYRMAFYCNCGTQASEGRS